MYGDEFLPCGRWTDDSETPPSVAENDGYFNHRVMMQVLAEIYDPGAAHIDEATCWPSRATTTDLEGLPPHMISVNELDPLRDEGLDYYRKLQAASAWTNPGLSHEGESLFRATMPDVYAANVRSVSGFAHSLGRRAGR
ncbi:alpha/beta hydrolase fold domain-containing protein [Streptomyces canus]|uniref:alpha/beta hydrolase fold domain-containing protein n=1 Tax=Streptomyces canus TaxID=58343 RepID=UPI0033C5B77D